MQTSSRNIAKALVQSLRDGADPSKLAKSFSKYLEENHMQGLAPNILRNLDREVADLEKKTTVDIRVSHEISASLLKEIEKKVGKKPEDKSTILVDKDLIGGFRAVYQGKVFDGSIKNYLKELRSTLIQ